MGRFRLQLEGDRRVVRVLDGANPRRSPQFVRAGLVKGGLLIQRSSSSKQIQRGGKGPPLPDRLTSRTGTGRRSIRVDRGGLSRFFVEIGSDLEYMRVHEFGGVVQRGPYSRSTPSGGLARVRVHTANYPARPWLEPALDDVNDDLGRIFVEEWRREVDRR